MLLVNTKDGQFHLRWYKRQWLDTAGHQWLELLDDRNRLLALSSNKHGQVRDWAMVPDIAGELKRQHCEGLGHVITYGA